MTEEEKFLHFRKLGWFWTFSIDENFQEHRTLVNSRGCNSELEFAPERLPILQINQLPETP